MINNRQNGRRRGRGGPRPQGMDNRPTGGGNRTEPRSRGNAPQLHEKYKAMARDAQQAGDRVQTEYYLQFADHYFRILNETRARFDEQRPRHGDNGRDREDMGRDDAGREDGQGGDDYEDEDGEAVMADDEPSSNGRYEEGPRPQARSRGDFERSPNSRPAVDDRPQREDRGPRDERPHRDARPVRDERDERPQRTRNTPSFEPSAEAAPDAGARDRDAPQRNTRPLRAPLSENGDGGGGIDFDRLPPAISRPDADGRDQDDSAAGNGASFGDGASDSGADDAPRPARRPRRPRESTPAAA